MDDSTKDQAIDAVIEETVAVEEATTLATPTDGESQAELIVSLTNLINANLAEIETLERDMSKQKEMIDSVLENDSTYRDHAEKAKEAARIKSNTKVEILKRPDVKHVVEKLKELKENVKETREELSNYIQEYAQVSGQNYFEAQDGTIQEIFYVAKLRKKSA